MLGRMDTESAHLIDAWHDFYVMLGTSSAALIGLLFVATSLHLGEVMSNPAFRIRAYNATLYLLTLFVEAALILVPQPVPFLGAELTVLNLVGLTLPISTTYTFVYKHRIISRRGGMKMSRVVKLSGAYLLGIAGGIALIQGSQSATEKSFPIRYSCSPRCRSRWEKRAMRRRRNISFPSSGMPL